MNYQVLQGDCREVMKTLADCSVDAVVTDPPYELGFMLKSWDRTGIAYDVNVWTECLRVLKPGGHLLAFGGSRTYHRLACAIEDAAFEIRDQIQWIYGSGFPKSLDVSKAIDAAAGAEREVVGHRDPSVGGTLAAPSHDGWRRPWMDDPDAVERGRQITAPATDAARRWNGWGTALKPAHEPIVMARKPLMGTVAENVLQHGTGGLNIAACRITTDENLNGGSHSPNGGERYDGTESWRYRNGGGGEYVQPEGRWPANVILSYPEDQYELRSNVTPEQQRELFKWLYENA